MSRQQTGNHGKAKRGDSGIYPICRCRSEACRKAGPPAARERPPDTKDRNGPDGRCYTEPKDYPGNKNRPVHLRTKNPSL